jgi:hypothetical protein
MAQSSQPAQTNLRPGRLKEKLLAALRAGPGKALSGYLHLLSALRMGGITRRYWKAFAGFWVLAALVAMTWGWNVPADNARQASILSAAWWTAPVELNAWKKYPAFKNATIRVSEINPATGRVWIAGDNGLLGYRDDRSASWTLFSFDTQNNCFHVSETPCTSPPATSTAQVTPAPEKKNVPAPETSAPNSGSLRGQPSGAPNPPASGNARQAIQQVSPITKNAANQASPVPMTVKILSPKPGDTLSGTVTISAAVSGYPGDVKIEFRLDTKSVLGSAGTPPFAISLDTTKLPNGKYELTAVAITSDGRRARSAPIMILVNNARKAAAAAAAFLAGPEEYRGARLRMASFSPDANAREKLPTKSALPQPETASSQNPPAQPPANPPESPKMVPPDIIGLDTDATPFPILLASIGRSFESRDGGNTWTLSTRRVSSAAGAFSYRIGRRYFYFSQPVGSNLWIIAGRDQIVDLAKGRLFQAPRGYEGVELVEGGKQTASRPLPQEVVQAVAATNDAKHLWFAAKRPDGTSHVERSSDFGKNWTVQYQTKQFTVFDISFDAAGQTGLAVGDLGAVLRTTDGGNTWTPITRGAADPDRERALEKAGAGGSQGQDLGDILLAHYWKLPPPWSFLLLLLALCAVTPAIALAWVPVQQSQMPGSQTIADFLSWWDGPHEPPKVKPPSVANEALSDRPLEEEDADQLQFTPLARGLSGFLSNPKTLLPVTIAIQGGWGTGKSSLMNLLRRELKAIGFRPVLFNAWHHQEDENLLASLLETVRSEAVPGLLSAAGPWFRMRLAGRRAVRNLQGIFAMLFVLMVLCGAEYCWHNISQGPLVGAISRWNARIQDQAAKINGRANATVGTTANNQQPSDKAPPAGGTSAAPGAPPAPNTNAPETGQEQGPAGTLLGYVLALLVNFYSLLHTLFEPAEALSFGTYVTGPLPALYVLFRILPSAWKQLRAFGENPANLLHTAAPGASDKQLNAQTTFRNRFAKQFEDVTLALGDRHRLVIFVDDLDRCRPAKVGELLEDLNYVVTAGPCAVVLGIEPQAVRAALGLNFRETAEEREDASGPDLLAAAHAKRAAFAERYVEKLINIELNVPKPTDAELEKLLQAAHVPQPTPSQRRAQAVVRWGRRFEPVLAGLILAGLGWGIGEGAVSFANWRAVSGVKRIADSSASLRLAQGTSPQQSSPASAQDAANSTGATAASTGGADASSPIGDARTAVLLPLVVDAESPFPGLWLTGWRLWVTLPAFVLALLWPATRERRALAKDSQKFEDARQVWGPVIIQCYHTPRAIKRFMNRLRYLAMLEHPPRQPLPFLEQWVADRAPEPEAGVDGIPEDVLVALASLEAVTPNLVASSEEFHKVLREQKPEVRATIEAIMQNHDGVFRDVRLAEYFSAYSNLRRGIASHRDAILSPNAGKVSVATR